MSNYLIQSETLSGIANAIRGKTGGSTEIPVEDFATEISGIETGHTTTIDGVEVERDLDLESITVNLMSSIIPPVSDLSTSDIKGCVGCKRGVNGDYYVCYKQIDPDSNKPLFYVMKNTNGVWSTYMVLDDADLPNIANLVYAKCFSINDELYISFHDSSTGVRILDCSNALSSPTKLYDSFQGDTPDNVSVHGCVAIGRDIDGTGVFLMLSSNDNHDRSYLFKISNHSIVCLNSTYTLTYGESILTDIEMSPVTNFIPYIIYDTTTKCFNIYCGGYRYSAKCSNTTTNRYYAMGKYEDTNFTGVVVPICFDSTNSKVYVLDVASRKVYSISWSSGDNSFIINESDGYGVYSTLGANVMFCILNDKKPFIFASSTIGTVSTIPAKMINSMDDLPNSSLVDTTITYYEEV